MNEFLTMLYTKWYEDEIKDKLNDMEKLTALREISSISMEDPFWLSKPEKKYKLEALPDTEMTGNQLYILMTCLGKDLGMPVGV